MTSKPVLRLNWYAAIGLGAVAWLAILVPILMVM